MTKLIAEARTNLGARDRLAELVYRPAFKRLDTWFEVAGLKRLNMQAEEIFDALWARTLPTSIDHVTFQDREHFLRLVLLRARQAAHRLAHDIRGERGEAAAGSEHHVGSSVDPAQAVEYAESVSRPYVPCGV